MYLEINISKGSTQLLGGLEFKAHKPRDLAFINEVVIKMEDVQEVINRLEAYKAKCIKLNIWELV